MGWLHSCYGRTPRKGSALRRALILALRPEGITDHEFRDYKICKTSLAACVERLRDDKGWDIRAFPAVPGRDGNMKPGAVFKVVGRFKWDGRYRAINIPVRQNSPLSPRARHSAELECQ